MPEEKEYIKNDVLIVAQALNVLFKENLKKMTQGSNALNDFKQYEDQDIKSEILSAKEIEELKLVDNGSELQEKLNKTLQEFRDYYDPEDPEYYSKGFTIYELMDSAGNLIDAYAVGNYEGKDTEVIIPSTWKEKPVIKILDSTFEGNDKITKVTIPASVQIIGKNAFANCNKLSSVTLGSNVTTIGEKAFYKCTVLKKITISKNVTSIGKSAFEGCKNLKTVNIKTTKLTKKNVKKNAFKGTHSKAKFDVPNSKKKSYTSILKARGVSKKATIK